MEKKRKLEFFKDGESVKLTVDDLHHHHFIKYKGHIYEHCGSKNGFEQYFWIDAFTL